MTAQHAIYSPEVETSSYTRMFACPKQRKVKTSLKKTKSYRTAACLAKIWHFNLHCVRIAARRSSWTSTCTNIFFLAANSLFTVSENCLENLKSHLKASSSICYTFFVQELMKSNSSAGTLLLLENLTCFFCVGWIAEAIKLSCNNLHNTACVRITLGPLSQVLRARVYKVPGNLR